MGDDPTGLRWAPLDGGNRDAEFDCHRLGQFSIDRKASACARKVIGKTAGTNAMQTDKSLEEWSCLSR
jgi:hypothetical protein